MKLKVKNALLRAVPACALFFLPIAAHAGNLTVCSSSPPTGSVGTDSTHTNNANFYTFYLQGNGSCSQGQLQATAPSGATQPNGHFTTNWNLPANTDFVAGMGWATGSKTAGISYSAGTFVPGSNAYLSLYGWSANGYSSLHVDSKNNGIRQHTEYYVLQQYGPYNPGGLNGSSADPALKSFGQATGKIDSANGTYKIFAAERTGPTVYSGSGETFLQVWLIRTSQAPANDTIYTSAVFSALAAAGIQIDPGSNATSNYQVIASEGYASTGNADVTVWH